jgi:hypothetical protein
MSTKTHKHHVIPRSRGGSDHPSNIVELSEYEHAYEHALDFVLFEHSPRFDCRHSSWKLLPEDLQLAVRKELSKRMLSRKISESTREKISIAKRGVIFSEEHKQKLSWGQRNRKPDSKKTRQKKSEATRGKNHPMFGKTHSEESKKKMSQSHRDMSEETRRKISEAAKRREARKRKERIKLITDNQLKIK